MTQLALVQPKPTPEAEPKKAYNEYDQKTIRDYKAKLGVGRYFKLYNSASPYARIVSGFAPDEPLPVAWLADDFRTHCVESGRKFPDPLPTGEYLSAQLEVVTGTVFKPKGAALVRDRYSRHKSVNTYLEFKVEHAPIELPEHFHCLFDCLFPDPIERRTFLQYVSHMVRYPEVRPSWHPMLLSETGTGKGFLFAEILTPILSGQTRLLKRYSELTGRFANVMRGTILILLDDCKAKREDQQTQLKSLMTEERVLLEEKGLAAGMVTTYTRFILASNEEVPLDLDDTERRWWIPKRLGYSQGLTGDEGRKERKYNVIQPLSEWLKRDGAVEAMHEFFMSYDLTGFDPKSPPMTDTLREQIAKSVTVEESFATDFLSEHETKVLKSQELSAAFSEAGMTKPSNQAIGKLFAGSGFRQDLLFSAGKRTRWWFPMNMSKDDAEALLASREGF